MSEDEKQNEFDRAVSALIVDLYKGPDTIFPLMDALNSGQGYLIDLCKNAERTYKNRKENTDV